MLNGACHCGQISFTAEIDPAQVVVCHCTDCQVLSGSPLRAVAEALIGMFKIRGSPKRYVFTQHGIRMAQVFCPKCGTPLYATAQENPTSVIIRLGCVEQRAQLKSVIQIWQGSALPWLVELATVPTSSEQPGALPVPNPSVEPLTSNVRSRTAWKDS